ncbi:MAG: FMN-binding protein [Verrucomicrobia bacterium]|nr:FMN-binding protein [Verrucomicrobiota bacterium]
MKRAALQLYRLAVLALIAWLIRDLALRQRIQGDTPVKVDEVTKFFTNAAALRPDDSERDGLFVLDRDGRELGYVVRTQPRCRDIIGYCGVTDTLIALDPDWTILGLKVRASEDTRTHVGDVVMDRKFLKKWNGMKWDSAADLDLKKAGIEGVSGATMTSMGIARAVKARLKMSKDEIAARPPLHFGWRDWGMCAVLATAGLMAFGKPAWRHRWKRPYQFALILYVGFISGDLLAQSLLAGWAKSGIPWTTAPGLVLLTAASFLIPWATRMPLYCHHVCPHGAAQELLGRVAPARWHVKLPAALSRGLEYLPAALLLAVLLVVMLVIPLDLAGFEAFDAYLIRSAGFATIAVAIVGLVVSLFVPQAYCRFGCPTGALLNFIRTRGPTDHFTRRDAAALAFVALAAVLNWKFLPLNQWLMGLQ